MNDRARSLANLLDGELSLRWTRERGILSEYLRGVGLTGDEHSQSLYILPQQPADPRQYLTELRERVRDQGNWAVLEGESGDDKARRSPQAARLSASA